ncbi:MAG TPA: hypothetical protein VMT20_12110 [Terriglobia bacterium]|nr:hypothetical protein [Terriglobia bacterium]
MDVIVSVHSTGPSSSGAGPGLALEFAPLALSAAEGAQADPRAGPERSEGVGPTTARSEGPEWERTKPESYSSRSASQNMSVPGAWDPNYAAAYALAERIVGWLMSLGKRTKPEYCRNQGACKDMSADSVWASRNPNRSDGATSVGRVFRTIKTAFVLRKTHSQLSLLQTKPECKRREGAYQNMSKTLGWLGAAASFLLKRNLQKSRSRPQGQSMGEAVEPPR